MNILAVNWQDRSNPLAGGAEVHLEALLQRIAAKGHSVTLFCSSYASALPEEEIKGVKVIRRGNRYNFNLVTPFLLPRLVRENKFDVLIEDINKIPFYTPMYLNIPTLVVVPHLFSTTVFREINFALGMYIYLCEKPLVSVYRGLRFNVISDSTAEDIRKRGIPKDDISVIHCGIDNDTYNFDPDVRKFEKPSVLYLGRIKKYKSIDHILIAFKEILNDIPDAQLNIIGDGDYLPALKQLAGTLNISDKTVFHGYVDRAAKVDMLRRSHVAICPSLKEGWGLTNIEANACGTAVIAADSPGLRDSVVDNKTGFLYPYGKLSSLAERIKTILIDDNERARLEKGGLEWVNKFNWDDAAEMFLQELERVAS